MNGRLFLPVVVLVLLCSLVHTGIAYCESDAELIPLKETPSKTSESRSDTDDQTLGPFSVGMIVVAILLGGFVFLFLEVTVIPGFGIAGIAGITLIISGIALAFWKLAVGTALAYAGVSALALLGLIVWALYVFPHTRFGKKFVLGARASTEEGYIAVRDLSEFLGREGVAASQLRPSGTARFGDDRMDVLSDGDFIPKGTKIKVARIKNNNLVVVPIEEQK